MSKYLDLDDVAATSELAAQELAELRAENNHLRLIGESALKVCNELDEVTLALPMDYLDPPDGGNVSLGVQVARMKAHRDELRAENARLREYVGDGLLRSDYKSAAEMRIEINRLTDEVASLHTEIMAQQEDEADLRNSLRNRDDEIKRLRADILHLRIYATGQRQAHEIRMAPHVGPTDFAAWGITPDTEPTEDPS